MEQYALFVLMLVTLAPVYAAIKGIYIVKDAPHEDRKFGDYFFIAGNLVAAAYIFAIVVIAISRLKAIHIP